MLRRFRSGGVFTRFRIGICLDDGPWDDVDVQLNGEGLVFLDPCLPV